jgi:hypothetical protein
MDVARREALRAWRGSSSIYAISRDCTDLCFSPSYRRVAISILESARPKTIYSGSNLDCNIYLHTMSTMYFNDMTYILLNKERNDCDN